MQQAVWISSAVFLLASACSLTESLDDLESNVAEERPGATQLDDGGALSSGGSGAGGGFGGSGNEMCGDGLDGDDDGLIDCADPDCAMAGWSCVPEIEGFTGPVAYHRGALEAELPECAAPYTTLVEDTFAGLAFDPATCDCECSAPSGVACAAPVVSFYDGTACTGEVCVSKSGPAGQCLDGAGVCGAQADSLSIGPSLPSGGTCVASAQPTLAPFSWSTRTRTCAAPMLGQNGCALGALCAPPPAKPFAPELCVQAEGDLECPPAFPSKRLAHTGADDDRGCSACSCSAPKNVGCSAKVRWWKSYCGGSPDGEAMAPTPCTPTGPPTPDYEYEFEIEQPAATGGSCTPSGGAPSGSVQPTGPRTVCCAS